MSSTEAEAEADALARAIFRDIIQSSAAPAASFFPRAPDATAATYFTAPSRPTMAAADFLCPALGSVDAFVEALAAEWRSQGRPELAALSRRLGALCEKLFEQMGAESADVSPFVYTMF